MLELEPFDLRGSLAAVHRLLGFDQLEQARYELDKTQQRYGNITQPVLQLALTFQNHGRYQIARNLLEWLLANETEDLQRQQIQYARMINAETMGARGVASNWRISKDE